MYASYLKLSDLSWRMTPQPNDISHLLQGPMSCRKKNSMCKKNSDCCSGTCQHRNPKPWDFGPTSKCT